VDETWILRERERESERVKETEGVGQDSSDPCTATYTVARKYKI
jgi:hypothetical protein